MTDKKGIIRTLGRELEEIITNPKTNEATKNLIGKAIEFGYTVKECEAKYDAKNDPETAFRCIRRYEEIIKLLGK